MPRERTYADASKAIGETPMIQINRLGPEGGATIFAKCEFFQPLNSVKDRIGVAMIEAGERDGKINKETHIIEPTSGNTGIALAFVCSATGYKLTLTLPESMSVERRALLRAMGANRGCTHLTQLLGPVATTAIQTIASARSQESERQGEKRRPVFLNSCHSYADTSPVVKLQWPDFYRGDDSAQAGNT